MILNKYSYTGLFCAFFMTVSVCNAGSSSGLLIFQVGIGKVSFDKDLNTADLVLRGYTVNSYSQNTINKDSHSLSVSVPVTPKISAELGLQKMGEIKSSLDVTLPAGKSVQQAAQDIVDASPQQLGGLTAVIGANYIQPINSQMDLRLGAGVSLGKDDHRIVINGEEFDYDDSSTAPYVKLGLGVKLAPSFAITAHTERYFFDDPVDRYAIGLSYTY